MTQNGKQTLSALVENKPGVLNRVVSMLRRRNFNVDSLTVGRTANPDCWTYCQSVCLPHDHRG